MKDVALCAPPASVLAPTQTTVKLFMSLNIAVDSRKEKSRMSKQQTQVNTNGIWQLPGIFIVRREKRNCVNIHSDGEGGKTKTETDEIFEWKGPLRAALVWCFDRLVLAARWQEVGSFGHSGGWRGWVCVCMCLRGDQAGLLCRQGAWLSVCTAPCESVCVWTDQQTPLEHSHRRTQGGWQSAVFWAVYQSAGVRWESASLFGVSALSSQWRLGREPRHACMIDSPPLRRLCRLTGAQGASNFQETLKAVWCTSYLTA